MNRESLPQPHSGDQGAPKRYFAGVSARRITANQERRQRDLAGQYEYLELTISPQLSVPQARQALTEQAEYGKWELRRTRLYAGGGRQFVLRRRVMKVERTA